MDAEKFIADTLPELEEHGKEAVTAEERQWINFARLELGELTKLPAVIQHWKRTGSEAITGILVKDTVKEFSLAVIALDGEQSLTSGTG
jgi:hypothetical protein